MWMSLRTSDSRMAKRHALAQLEKWEREFDVLRAKRTLSEYELQNAIWDRYSDLVQSDETRRQQLPTAEDLDDVWTALSGEFGEDNIAAWRIHEGIAQEHDTGKHERATRLAILNNDVARGETRSVAKILLTTAKTRNLALGPRSRDERKLAQGLQRAEIEALRRADERDQGNFGGVPSDPLIKPPTAAAPMVAPPGESIMELFDVYAKENPRDISLETLKQSRTVVGLFAQFVGKHYPASRIGKKEVRDWKSALRLYPLKATETAAFRDMDFKQTIQANKVANRPPISTRTLNRYLASLGSYCKWLVAHGYLEHAPTTGMFITIDKDERKIHPYTSEELQKIFNSALFNGYLADGKEHKSGNVTIRDHRFWLPLMSLYSGARLGELCQLLIEDVQQMQGAWTFNITVEGEVEKRLKTKGSERVVPVHPVLIKLGFITFLEQVKAAGHKRLFPAIKMDSRGSRSGDYSGFYRRYIARIGVKSDRKLNFHSFRHGFADALRRAGYLDHEFGFILGHTQSNVTGRYGSLQEGDLARRLKITSSVEYPGLDLSGLMPSQV